LDYKLTTLLGLADRLGLEMVFMPKEAARGMPPQGAEPVVETVVERVIKRLANNAASNGDKHL
jgi:hypothetical protein